MKKIIMVWRNDNESKPDVIIIGVIINNGEIIMVVNVMNVNSKYEEANENNERRKWKWIVTMSNNGDNNGGKWQ